MQMAARYSFVNGFSASPKCAVIFDIWNFSRSLDCACSCLALASQSFTVHHIGFAKDDKKIRHHFLNRKTLCLSVWVPRPLFKFPAKNCEVKSRPSGPHVTEGGGTNEWGKAAWLLKPRPCDVTKTVHEKVAHAPVRIPCHERPKHIFFFFFFFIVNPFSAELCVVNYLCGWKGVNGVFSCTNYANITSNTWASFPGNTKV